METKREITEVTARRYQKQDKKGKTAVLDEFAQMTGGNRKYAIHKLANWGKSKFVEFDGKPVELKSREAEREAKAQPCRRHSQRRRGVFLKAKEILTAT